MKKEIVEQKIEENYFSKETEEIGIEIEEANVETGAPGPVAFCKDLHSLIEHINEERHNSEILLKFGIDGGSGFLKICLSMQSLAEPNHTTSSFSKYICKNFKDSGVKKLIVIAIASNTQENYSNIAKLWSLLKINEFTGVIATDLKLANILLGIMTHASSNPCTWCYAQKGHLDKPGLDRTIGNSLQHYQEWFEAGAVRKDAKKFKTFTGNSCKILLSKVDLLRANCELGCLRYVESLDCLGRVVHECFGMILTPNYKSSIADFRRSYLALLKSVTPKIHAIFFHVEEFCDSTGNALGFYSEQAVESVHHDHDQ
ncbi:unnamed protein product [Psylliodes chrysocephalus]|uniref:Uncharacterized protein n=1 Tax=Psylliodes chrysocephalus TaxID=3402493 RepID=A0A9P0G5V5_9CUCU|nr:unnamed protein product [Psylliodes chrysocephala]